MSLTDIETPRLSALKSYEILDTPADGNFDRLTSLAAKMFNMPIALITLVDEDRIWFKSKYGLDVPQIDREPGLCASAILGDDVYLVENAKADPRCLANPLVAGEFGLQFYAAAPLKTKEGYKLGTFCVIDRSQRYMNREQMDMLQQLAAIAVDEMELRLSARIAVKALSVRVKELEAENKKLAIVNRQS